MRLTNFPVFQCCFVAIFLFQIANSAADEITFFGDFEDDFGGVPVIYDSDIPYEPDSFIGLMHEKVVGISKFDPSLGTLTDVVIFTEEAIAYSVSGGMTISEVDDSLPDYFASIGLVAEIQLSYDGVIPSAVFTEFIPLEGADLGDMGSGSIDTPIFSVPPADGALTGSASVFDSIELADFVGTGFVDSLFVDLIIQDTAAFSLDNATATASLEYDVFDGDSGADDPVIGVTYIFDSVSIPEPGNALILCSLLPMLLVRKRKPPIEPRELSR